MLSEPVRGMLTVRAPAGLKLQPIRPRRMNPAPVTVPYADGRYTIELPQPEGTHWFILEKGEPEKNE